MVRKLEESDVDEIISICMGNPQFYLYTEARPTQEGILSDMKATPPGIDLSDKYYIGFFEAGEMAAVMDLIDGYPETDTAFIGFFMMNMKYQGRQIGTSIITEAADYLKKIGFHKIRLAIDKDNPQSRHFWKKNGFLVIKEAEANGGIVLVAEKSL